MKKLSLLLLLLYLGVSGNYLAIRSAESAEPLAVLPYCLQMYPPADQQAFRHGIPISSPRAFARICEDYFS